MEPVYTISQASDLVGRKAYVLRYWEEELSIPIKRNDMGHRYYTGYDIQLFLNIKELQKRGLQLRAIKDLIPRLYYQEPGTSDSPVQLLPGQTLESQEASYIHAGKEPYYSGVDLYKIQEFQSILEKLICQGLKDQQALERESYNRNLDRVIRIHQQSHRQSAAAKAPAPRRSSKKHH
jgi:DNA-binding transcriptional MerR regulator